ncbi:MAG: protein kinase [Deltaproteobacteria bacterium]|jgi:serine/threonine protein kinase
MEARSQPPELVFGKYHIVKPLKIGGTAAIYLAIMRGENNFSREVVVKRPLPHLVADQRSRLMFIDEAHIAARLSHPNICQVLDLVSRENELYLVLEYLRGVDVREIIKRCIQLTRLMPPEVAVWIAIETAAGLHCAHDAAGVDGNPLNLVHRDVSPKNIRVTYTGSVKVIDFGIARAMNRATETAAGTIKGTLGYMSPEQILGDDIDRRSDIFAFGICLFQMLTCRNPFDGPTLKERVRRLTQAPIPSVREFNPSLDDEIAGIVAKCLDRDIDERYQTMREVQVALDRYLGHLQVVSPRQRLIEFLEDIFPNSDEEDTALKSALSEISSVVGKIDTAQKLRFPDDPPTETDRPAVSASSASAVPPGATAATRGASEFATQAGETEADRYFTNDTARLMEPKPVFHADVPAQQTGATVLEEDPPQAKAKSPLLWMGLAGFVLAAVVAAAVTLWPQPPTVERLTPPDDLPTVAARVGPDGQPIRTGNPTDATGTNTAGTNAAGRNAAGTNATGTNATDTNATDTNATGTNATGTNATGTNATDTTGTAVAPPATGVTPPPSKAVKPPPKKTVAPPPPKASNRQRAQLYFQTARRFEKERQADTAKLMYHLAFGASGRRADPSLYLNLGLLHNRAHDTAKAKACLAGFLDRASAHPSAPRVRTLVSSFPPVKTVACVDKREARAARRQYQRRGAQIDAWVQETVEAKLRR